MANFKKGDKVRVIQDSGPLNIGDILTVMFDQTTEFVRVKGADGVERGQGGGWFATRFVLEAAAQPTIDFTKPLETQDGTPVTLITATGRGAYPVLAYIGDDSGVERFTAKGKYYGDETPSTYDLRNVKPKPLTNEVFANVYKRNGELHIAASYATAAEAKASRDFGHVGMVKITLVEGEYAD